MENRARSAAETFVGAQPEQSVAARNGERSVSSALERVVETSERVISKHIDLAVLEARGTFAHMLHDLVGAIIVVVLGCGAWFTLVGAAVAACSAGTIARLLLFGLINAGGAMLTILTLRRMS